MRCSSMSTSSKSPRFRRYSARIFSIVRSSEFRYRVRLVDGEPEAQEVADLTLAPADLAGVEDVLAQHLLPEVAGGEREDRRADERQQEMRDVRHAQLAGAHALAEERRGRADDAPERRAALEL